MKRVLNVNNGYPSETYPNYCTYIQTISECLEQSGLLVDTLVIVYNRKLTYVNKLVKYIVFWCKLFLCNFKKYDYIYINHFPYCWPIFFNLSAKKERVIIHCHGDDVVGKSLYKRCITKLCLRRIKDCLFIVPSEYFKSVTSDMLGISKERIIVSPSGGVDTNVFVLIERREVISNYYTLGFPSGMSEDKGANMIMYLVKNALLLEEKLQANIRFRIIDYGADMSKYRNILVNSRHVILVPKIPKNEMVDFYNSIDLLLMPSNRESLGLVVLESMSCGKPVVTFDKLAFPEFVVSGLSGELVTYSQHEDSNYHGFIEAIQIILKKRETYNPRVIIENKYSKEYVINQYKEIFR